MEMKQYTKTRGCVNKTQRWKNLPRLDSDAYSVETKKATDVGTMVNNRVQRQSQVREPILVIPATQETKAEGSLQGQPGKFSKTLSKTKHGLHRASKETSQGFQVFDHIQLVEF